MDIEIPEILDSDEYLERAFSKAGDEVSELKQNLSEIDAFDRKKRISEEKVEFIREYLNDRLKKVILGFPKFEDMSDFYTELMKESLDYEKLKTCIANAKEGLQDIREIGYYHSMKIENAKSIERCDEVLENYYDEVARVLADIDDDLRFMREVRQTIVNFPSIKKGLFTVGISGLAGVGKTTLLNELCDESYPAGNDVETETLNLGFFKENYQRVQVIDAPGVFCRFDDDKIIERQARLVFENQVDLLITVINTEFDVEEQLTYVDELCKDVDVLVYIIGDAEGVGDELDVDWFTDVDELRSTVGEIAFDQVEF